MKINQKQILAVVSLPAEKRFQHFVKLVADSEEVWGLYNEGWALAATNEGTSVFPLWPAKEYAEICAVNEWERYEPLSFSLEDFLNDLLPNLENDGVLPGIFYTPKNQGITPSIQELREAIEDELKNY